MAFDNALAGGWVADPDLNDPATIAIGDLAEHVRQDDRRRARAAPGR